MNIALYLFICSAISTCLHACQGIYAFLIAQIPIGWRTSAAIAFCQSHRLINCQRFCLVRDAVAFGQAMTSAIGNCLHWAAFN